MISTTLGVALVSVPVLASSLWCAKRHGRLNLTCGEAAGPMADAGEAEDKTLVATASQKI